MSSAVLDLFGVEYRDRQYVDPMEWVKPEYSRTAVNKAGEHWISPNRRASEPMDLVVSLQTIYNWRSSHSFPLNTFQQTLRRRARIIDQSALVAQRLKRFPSIVAKLENNRKTMKLSQMQDIGGCRAVMPTMPDVWDLVRQYDKGFKDHTLARKDDYITTPKASGYRSVHFAFKYRGEVAAYRDLKIEIQIRSKLQHAWATAVETVGLFTSQALKSVSGKQIGSASFN